MTNDVLLIFLNDQNERTKFSQSLGEEKAQEINEKLELAACAAVSSIHCTKIVLYSAEKFSAGIWNTSVFKYEAQKGMHLNTKIQHAFAHYIIQNKNDVNKVVFVAADCPQLTQQIIEKRLKV